MQLIKPGTKFDFMGMRKYFYALSAFLLVSSIVAMFVPGPNWGTDFKGGTEVELVFKQPVQASKIREAVEASGFAAPDVVSVSAHPNQYLIRVQEVSALSDDTKDKLRNEMCFSESSQKDENRCPAALRPTELKFSPGGDKISARYDETPVSATIAKQVSEVPAVKLRDALASVVVLNEREHKIEIYLKSKGDQILEGLHEKLGPDVAPETALRVEWIGPKAGAQLRDAAFKSVVIALFFIMAYIAVRFDLRFAPGAILSLLHDVLIAIGAMCLLRKEITLSTIAAVLTVLGYSITDTVVVYDRIPREPLEAPQPDLQRDREPVGLRDVRPNHPHQRNGSALDGVLPLVRHAGHQGLRVRHARRYRRRHLLFDLRRRSLHRVGRSQVLRRHHEEAQASAHPRAEAGRRGCLKRRRARTARRVRAAMTRRLARTTPATRMSVLPSSFAHSASPTPRPTSSLAPAARRGRSSKSFSTRSSPI